MFFDAAEELFDKLTPQEAFGFLSQISNPATQRAFQGIYEARYISDPAVLRNAIYDPQTETGVREAALREMTRRLKTDSVALVAKSFGIRPEHAAIFEGRLRQSLQRGDDNTTAKTIATLLGLLGAKQLAKLHGTLRAEVASLSKNQSDPARMDLAKHMLYGVKEALGKDREPSDALEGPFRDLIAPELKSARETTEALKKTLGAAAGGDESARKELLDSLDGESVLDFISAQIKNGDGDMAVKFAKVFGRRAEDGVYYLDLSARDLGFSSPGKAHQTLRLGKADSQIKLALQVFDHVLPVDDESRMVTLSRLQRFVIDPQALNQRDRIFLSLRRREMRSWLSIRRG